MQNCVMIECEDFDVKLLREGDMLVKMYELEGAFEPAVVFLWEDLMRSCEYAIDVGAYTGLYTIIAEKHGVSCTAFEPHVNNLNRMLRNFQINGVSPQVRNCALGNPQNGHSYSRFSFNSRMPYSSGGAIIGAIHPAPGSRNETVGVDVYALDALRGLRCDAIKIDVEGAELNVLQGARNTLQEQRPYVVLETLTEKAHDDIQHWMAEESYIGEQLDERNWFFKHVEA